MEGPRPLRGPVQPALVALPHRHQRLLRPPRGPEAPGPARSTWGRPTGSTRASAPRCPSRPGCCRCPTPGWCPRRPTPPSRPRCASPCGWPSSPPSSTCRRASGRCSCCARSCASRPPRSPSCSTPPSRRSTARCSGPGPRSGATTSCPPPTCRPSTPSTGPCSTATRTPSSATTSRPWWRCSTRTPPSPCRPSPFWLQGAQEAGRFWLSPEPSKCRDSRLTPVEVNGQPGYAQYKPSADGTRHEAWCLQVVQVGGGVVERIDYFLDTPTVFPLFGLPLVWPGD